MEYFDYQKFVEIVLYILQKTGGIDRYHLFKILYFAEMKHLAKWGVSAIPDTFYALPHGPVPTMLYDAIKEINHPKSEFGKMLASAVCFANDDASAVMLAARNCDEDYISEATREALDASIEENAHLLFSELKDKSHDQAWQEANNVTNGKKIISPVSMAEVVNKDEDFLAYIQEMAELNESFKSF